MLVSSPFQLSFDEQLILYILWPLKRTLPQFHSLNIYWAPPLYKALASTLGLPAPTHLPSVRLQLLGVTPPTHRLSRCGFAGADWVTRDPGIANQNIWSFCQEELVQEGERDPVRDSETQGALLELAGQQTLSSPKAQEAREAETNTPI